MLKAAISNIAWDISQDDQVAAILSEHAISAIECAPTKYFPKPLEATPADVDRVRQEWQARGIEIVAMQALLFGQPQLQLLQSAEARGTLVDYTAGILRLGAKLGAKRYVFGSPKNRDSRGLSQETIAEQSLAAWRELARVAAELGVVFCLEPNPAVYDCNYILLTTEAWAEAERVNSAGFGINLDTGIMLLNGEDPAVTIPRVIKRVQHVHISEPSLAPVGREIIDHRLIASLLREHAYQGYVSVEMRAASDKDQSLEQIRTACGILREFYLE
jgi:D-psicose/D-tagatose/L-ribulose 3-epimerase